MIVLSIISFVIGMVFLIIAVWEANRSSEKKITMILFFCLVIGIFFVDSSGYYSGVGRPEFSTYKQLSLPENEVFIVKAITEDEQNSFILAVPFTNQKRTPNYYQIPKETMPENTSVNDKIVNDRDLIRKI